MKACLTGGKREHRTFHCKRLWLATPSNISNTQEPDAGVSSRALREDSTRIYGRMDKICQANAREKVSFRGRNTNSLPRIDPVAYNDQNMPGKRSREGLFQGQEHKQLAQDRSSGVQRSKQIILPDLIRMASQVAIDA